MRKLVRLQMLRAIAASLVIADHAMGRITVQGPEHLADQSLRWCFGWVGVAVFFVTSGLILYRTAENSFGSTNAALNFAKRRVLRIVPMYWLVTAVHIPLDIIKGEAPTFTEIWKSLFFFPYNSDGASVIRPIIGQGWTLDYEMFFYLIFAACLVLPRRFGLTVFFATFIGLVAIGAALRPLIPYADPITPLTFWTDPIILLFAAGTALGYFETKADRWHTLKGAVPISCLILIGGAVFFAGSGAVFPMQLPWQIGLGLMSIAAVYLCTSTRAARPSRIGTMLEKAGDASYSTYLIHVLLIPVIFPIWSKLPGALHVPIVFILAVVIAANLAGYVVYFYVERPMSSYFKKLLDRRPSPQ